MKIKKRDSSAILNSLAGGVVPSRGIHHIVVGRTEEANQILNDLKNIKNGSSIVKFIIGPFGSGKSFIQALIKQLAFKENFVVANADFTPERRLYGGDRKSIATYTELMKNLSISSKPGGKALKNILEKWINEVQNRVVEEKSYTAIDFDNPSFLEDVENEIVAVVSKMDELTGGYDFARVLSLYFKGFIDDNSEIQRCALRWLRGEYTTKTEARRDLGVRTIIDDNNYYDYLKVMAKFVKQIGYSGLVINFDEAINLYKINHSQARDKNYETILKIYNDTLQGQVEGLYVTFGGTPEFLEDERRGMFSYGALKRRLKSNKYETKEFRDLSQPVIKLTPLNQNDIFLLLSKLKDIHAIHYGYTPEISKEEIESFLKKEYDRPGASENLTVGDIIRNFIGALNILYQNPDMDRKEIFEPNNESETQSPPVFSRFSTMEGS